MNDPLTESNRLTIENQQLIELIREREATLRINPDLLLPGLFRPCTVRVLMVADGGLDFSMGDFGLRTFVRVLTTSPPGPYVRFKVSLAHIRSTVSDDAVMEGDADIVRSIKGFKFDKADHFKAADFDQVWLFGISTSYREGTAIRTTGCPTKSCVC